MNDESERMVWTRYKNEKGFVTSIKLSKADCNFIKEKFGNRTKWIQTQHDLLIAKYRDKHGITAAITGCPRDKIHTRIAARVLELRWQDAGL